MSGWTKFARVLSVLVLAGVVGVFIGWMESRHGDVQPIAVPAAANLPSAPIAPAAAPAAEPSPAEALPMREETGPAPSTVDSTNWEEQLDNVLLSDTDANDKADRILAMMPTVPVSAQVELSQHLVNMVQDDHYDGAAQLLTNAATPEAVSTVLMNDLLNRNDALKLPMLLAVARDDDHPLKDQARELLELLIQDDKGTNWDQWSASIDTWLQNNQQ